MISASELWSLAGRCRSASARVGRKSPDLKSSALARPTAKPMSVDPTKMSRKKPIAVKMAAASTVSALGLHSVGSKRMIVLKSTIATASFITLSPNTSMYRCLSTLSCVKMASTVTGSVALMRLPKSTEWSGVIPKPRMRRRRSISAKMTKVEISVPRKAYVQKAPAYMKKYLDSSVKPALKIMGGTNAMKKNEGSNAMNESNALMFSCDEYSPDLMLEKMVLASSAMADTITPRMSEVEDD